MKLSIVIALALLAQTPSADALIDQGVDLREQGRDAEALAKFEAAYEATKGSRALAQIALAEQALGRWVDAHNHLRAALGDRSDPWIKRNRTALLRGLKTIRTRLAAVDVVASIDGAEIRINGKLVGRHPLPKPVLVTAGTVIVQVSADGYWPLTRNLELRPKTRARERFDLIAKPAPAPRATSGAPPSTAPRASSVPVAPSRSAPVASRRAPAASVTSPPVDPGPDLAPYGWVAGGAAFAAAGTGVVFLLIRNGHIENFNNDEVCLAGGRTRLENCGDERDAADTAELISIATFSAAGLFAVTSAVLFALDGDGDSSVSAGDAATLCGLGPGDVGVGCLVRF